MVDQLSGGDDDGQPTRIGPRPIAPRGDIRSLFLVDLSGFANLAFRRDPASPNQIRRFVDNVAISGADVFGQEVFAQGWTLHYRSDNYEYDARPQHQKWVPVLDAGITPLEIFIEQAKENGMKFLAGVRINDDHGTPTQAASWIHDHPELKLRDLPPGRFNIPGNTLDFTFPEAREFYFGAIKEIVDRFDVDGVELTFRSCNHFPYPRSISRERQPLMTELIRQIHSMMDEVGRAKGKSLILGVRVPQTLDECHDCGLDIPEWIGEDLISYVSPSDTMYSDINAPYDTFYELTRNKACRLFPGIQPYACISDRSSFPMRQENYRAIAQNMYGAGADGLSFYNYHMQWGGMRSGLINNYPQAMAYLRELREPERIAEGTRVYTFRPIYDGLWKMFQKDLKGLREQDASAERDEPGRQYPFGALDAGPTGAIMAEKLVLDRTVDGGRGKYRFRLAEDPGSGARVYLYFRATDLQPDEKIAIDVNGTAILDSEIDFIWYENGRPSNFGRELPPHTEGMFELKPGVTVNGDNYLGATLTSYDADRTQPVVIDEIDVSVVPSIYL